MTTQPCKVMFHLNCILDITDFKYPKIITDESSSDVHYDLLMLKNNHWTIERNSNPLIKTNSINFSTVLEKHKNTLSSKDMIDLFLNNPYTGKRVRVDVNSEGLVYGIKEGK